MIGSIYGVLVITAYLSALTLLPMALMHYVGWGFLLFYPLWIVGSYMYINHSCKKREPINFMSILMPLVGCLSTLCQECSH